MTDDNELYSDLHSEGSKVQRRTYNRRQITSKDIDQPKAHKNKDLNTMKCFVLEQGPPPTSSDIGYAYVLDKRSFRIYSGPQSILSNVLDSDFFVDQTPSDVDRLIAKLKEVKLQSWETNTPGLGASWVIGIEYEDGTIEQHFGAGLSPGFEALLNYVKSESDTFKDRMLQDRKTTVNVDYLVAYCGWDPGIEIRDKETISVEFENIERIMVFQAEGPHEILDHSRNPQKTLFLDVLNKKLYYEPQKTVYENITKASDEKTLSDDYATRVLELLQSYGIHEWKINSLYISTHEGRLVLESGDIPAWSIAIQYSDGTILHFSGDAIGEGGAPEGCYELLAEIFALEF